MKVEEVELYEKDDKVIVVYGSNNGMKGTVANNQIDKDFYVDVLLEDGFIVKINSDNLELMEGVQ